ncbi:MAG: glycosyltransferase family 2 protein [Desulfobacteraceae bacterium]|nr:MAG: glycosyltransferase family 2 protein [Desulfobacteraceae bacterium]
MKNPVVTVVITTCNRSMLVPQAVLSVLEQSYTDFELIVVDDRSEDDTSAVIKDLLNGRQNVYYHRHQERKGLAAARNTGIRHAKGDYIAFLDDDDRWKPQCLEKRMAEIQRIPQKDMETFGVAYCGHEIRKVDENRTTYLMPQMKGNIQEDICKNDLWTISSSFIFPKKVLEHIGGFDETLISSIDHDVWMNLAAHGYYSVPIMEALVLTIQTGRHQRMVTDISHRIRGVEQYLSKWKPTLQKWMGSKGGEQYIRHYRARVLGGLAGEKSCTISQSIKIIRHILSYNGYSLPAVRKIFFFTIKRMLSRRLPQAWIDKLTGCFLKQS